MRWTVERITVAGGALMLFFLVATGVGFWAEMRDFVKNVASLEAADRRVHILARVFDDLQDAETGQRGYLITGRTIYLEPYDAARADLGAAIQALREAYTERGQDQAPAHVSLLEQLVAAKVEEMARSIELRRSEGFEAAQAVVLEDSGKRSMDGLRAIIGHLQAEENTAQRYETERTKSRASDAMTLWLAGTALVMSIVAASILIVLREIRENRQLSDQLQHDVRHDRLTGLPNRSYFNEHLQLSLARAGRDKSKLAVLFLDLNGFKQINDNLGHMVGDLALIEVANRFRTAVRSSDFVARLGGDEFVVLASRVGGQKDIDVLVRKLQEAMAGVSLPALQGRRLGASVGVAVYPDDGLGADELIAVADDAMYVAKGRATPIAAVGEQDLSPAPYAG